jgi:hypothetical protein
MEEREEEELQLQKANRVGLRKANKLYKASMLQGKALWRELRLK